MKKLFALWLAKHLNKLKQSNPIVWIIVAGVLYVINMGLTDPDVISVLTTKYGIDPQHLRWGVMISAAASQLYSPHTSELAEEAKVKKRLSRQQKRANRTL